MTRGKSPQLHAYVDLLRPGLAVKQRDALDRLKAAGVEAAVGPHQKALTTSYRRERRAVALPISHAISRDDAAMAAGALAAVLESLPA
jgi:hypothetical protein